MKQIKKMLGMVCACAMMFSMTAFAANHDFEFEFKNLNNQQTGSYEKSDNAQKWYISLRVGIISSLVVNLIVDCSMMFPRPSGSTLEFMFTVSLSIINVK